MFSMEKPGVDKDKLFKTLQRADQAKAFMGCAVGVIKLNIKANKYETV